MSALTLPVSERDHIRGPLDAPIELVEYGDYECPHCKIAAGVLRRIEAEFGNDLCSAYRHYPLVEMHADAEPAAEAAEAADSEGRFWDMHDALYEGSPRLDTPDLVGFASALRLNVNRFREDLAGHRYLPRIREDVESGDASGVHGTPT